MRPHFADAGQFCVRLAGRGGAGFDTATVRASQEDALISRRMRRWNHVAIGSSTTSPSATAQSVRTRVAGCAVATQSVGSIPER
jgi:hypothetical protein